MIYSARLPAGYISDAHECHVEAATLLDAGGDGAAAGVPAGDHACMGGYDGALLVHLELEGDMSDSSVGGGGMMIGQEST